VGQPHLQARDFLKAAPQAGIRPRVERQELKEPPGRGGLDLAEHLRGIQAGRLRECGRRGGRAGQARRPHAGHIDE
jgi:hypothetical protein